MKKLTTLTASLLTLAVILATPASAAIITYDLSDKGFGALNAPDYGLRLDDLFGGNNNWTWSFDDPGTDMKMRIDTVNSTVDIFGTVYGGRDVGSNWDPATAGYWYLDFTYDHNVTITDATAGYWSVAYNANNYGSLQLLDNLDIDGIAGSDQNKYIAIGDYHGGSFVGNGGPSPSGPYVSAWLESTDGFILNNNNLANENYTRPNGGACCMDFGFRAHDVPEPTTVLLMGLGLLGLTQRRRKLF